MLIVALALGLIVAPSVRTRAPEMLTFDVRQSAPPPAAAPAPQPEKQVTPPPMQSEIVAPTPKVVVAPQPQQVSTAPVPPSPRMPDPTPPSTPAAAPAAAPAGPVSVGNLAAKMLSATPPRYPMEARRKREQGMVVLRLVLSEDGKVANITLHRSSGFASLDQAALDAVRRWRWSPTLRDGRAVEVTGLVQIPFVLKDG
jgi:protein TonB